MLQAIGIKIIHGCYVLGGKWLCLCSVVYYFLFEMPDICVWDQWTFFPQPNSVYILFILFFQIYIYYI